MYTPHHVGKTTIYHPQKSSSIGGSSAIPKKNMVAYDCFIHVWLVVWTPLKNISQLGWLFPIYGKIKHVPNHQPDVLIQYPVIKSLTIPLPKRLSLVGRSGHDTLLPRHAPPGRSFPEKRATFFGPWEAPFLLSKWSWNWGLWRFIISQWSRNIRFMISMSRLHWSGGLNEHSVPCHNGHETGGFSCDLPNIEIANGACHRDAAWYSTYPEGHFTKANAFFRNAWEYLKLVGGWATPLKNMKVNWDD